jgi:hypothetical protein
MIEKPDSTTFIEITNKDIYDTLMTLKRENSVQHEKILLHQMLTNGKVKLNRWIATTALTLAVAIIINIVM